MFKTFLSSLKDFARSIGETLFSALTNYMSRQGMLLTSVSLPNGAIVSIAASYGASKTLSVLSNAAAAVGTLEASHGIVVGDIFEVTSGWSRLTDKVVRASVVATNDVTFEGIVTTSTAIYPSGTGIGSIREVASFTQLAQILDSSSNGGEQQYLEYQFLESDAQKRIPTFKTAGGISFTVADDPTLTGYQLASTANDDRLARAVKILLPSGAVIYYNAFISLNKTPSLTINTLMAVEVTLSLLAEPHRYVS